MQAARVPPGEAEQQPSEASNKVTRSQVEDALRAAGYGTEKVVNVLHVRDVGKRTRKRGKARQSYVVLTVDAHDAARFHSFNRKSIISQVPLWSRTMTEFDRLNEVDTDGGQGFEMHFGTAGRGEGDESGRIAFSWIANTGDLQKEFLWCCLQMAAFERHTVAHNIDFVDLGLWAQANALDQRYAKAHDIFRRAGRAGVGTGAGGALDEGGALGAGGRDIQMLMTEQEESDVLELLDQSQLSIADAKKFEAQLSSKLRALEESNIHSILTSVEVAEDVCFRLDTAAKGVDELFTWMTEVNRGLVDIQDGISEIESQNNKLDTVHRNHEKLETMLREVLDQLSLSAENIEALRKGDLTHPETLHQAVLPAAHTLVHGLELKLNVKMQDMQVVREQKKIFEDLRASFANRAYDFIRRLFERDGDLNKEAHSQDLANSHALGDRTGFYSHYLRDCVLLLQVLKALDRNLFDKVVGKYVVSGLANLNFKDFGRYFSMLKACIDKKNVTSCNLTSNKGLGYATGAGAAAPPSAPEMERGSTDSDSISATSTTPSTTMSSQRGGLGGAHGGSVTAEALQAEEDTLARITGLARAGEKLGESVSYSNGFFYALHTTVQHCNREGEFIRSCFESPLKTVDKFARPIGIDNSEVDRLMEEMFSGLVKPELVRLIEKAEQADALQLLAMLRHVYEWDVVISERSLRDIPAFGNVTQAGLYHLAQAMTVAGTRTFKPNETIIKKGQPGATFFMIKTGTVGVSILDDGKIQVYRGSGEAFGEISLLNEGTLCTATALAVTAVTCYTLSRQEFETLVKDHRRPDGPSAEVAAKGRGGAQSLGGGLFVHNLLHDLAEEIKYRFRRYISRQVEELRAFSVPAKRCGFLAPIVNLAPFVQRAEAMLRGMSSSQRNDVLGIVPVSAGGSGTGVYTTLIDSIDGCLEVREYICCVGTSHADYFSVVLISAPPTTSTLNHRK